MVNTSISSLPAERRIQPREAECRRCLRSQRGILFSFSASPQPTFLCANGRAVLDITMSFGFSVSDFIATIELANRIRKEFALAPKQFKDISDEYVPQAYDSPPLTSLI